MGPLFYVARIVGGAEVQLHEASGWVRARP